MQTQLKQIHQQIKVHQAMLKQVGKEQNEERRALLTTINDLEQEYIKEMSQSITQQGYLSKQGAGGIAHGKRWHRRWCTMSRGDFKLRYYVDKDAFDENIKDNVKGSIDMSKVERVLMYPEDQSHPNSFGLETPSRTWKFETDDKGALQAWMRAIQEVCILANQSETESMGLAGSAAGSPRPSQASQQEPETRPMGQSIVTAQVEGAEGVPDAASNTEMAEKNAELKRLQDEVGALTDKLASKNVYIRLLEEELEKADPDALDAISHRKPD